MHNYDDFGEKLNCSAGLLVPPPPLTLDKLNVPIFLKFSELIDTQNSKLYQIYRLSKQLRVYMYNIGEIWFELEAKSGLL